MNLLTVLGTGNYQEICYTWENKEFTTKYVAEALCEFFQPQKVTVFVTAESKAQHWEKLHNKIGDHEVARQGRDRFALNDVLIPSGQSETEVWQIFDEVVASVEPNSKIIFDITHAFRSIPILVLLASAFLKKARNVEIQGVYYGAFEYGKTQAPIFDLTPAVKLLDWLTATDTFVNTGSSVELGKLLSTIQGDFYRNKRQNPSGIRPTSLLNFGNRIEAISRSIELIRPVDLMEETANLQRVDLTRLKNEVGAFAKPFELLLTQMQADYGQFAQSGNDLNSPLDSIKKQFLLLRWYVEKKLSSQAILLGREWLISALCIAEGMSDYRDPEKRKLIETQLFLMTGPSPNLHQSVASYVNDPQKLGNFWSRLADYRNDIAHAQMRRSNLSASTLQAYVEKDLIQGLSDLLPQYTKE